MICNLKAKTIRDLKYLGVLLGILGGGVLNPVSFSEQKKCHFSLHPFTDLGPVSKVPGTFRTLKSVLCSPCSHSRSKSQ